MARDHDWFRNRHWSDEVAAHFEAKLRRARDKPQYVRIQASYLAEAEPEVALSLLDRYFEFGDHFDLATAWLTKAEAHLARGEIDAAFDALRRALARERERPNLQTEAWKVYIELVLHLPRPELFDEVLAMLDDGPRARYTKDSARAIIYDARGMPGAREAAVRALDDRDALDFYAGRRDRLDGARYLAIRKRVADIAGKTETAG